MSFDARRDGAAIAVPDLGTDPTAGVEGDSLDVLLGHLQGNGPKVTADAGLARLRESRLGVIQHEASSRAETCLQDAGSLARLLGQLLLADSEAVRQEDLAAAARHVGQLVEEHDSWRRLAENAAMYRRQPAMASEVAQLWGRWARHWGEWPQA